MKIYLYKASDWRRGNPPLSEHRTLKDAKAEAMRLTKEQFGSKPPMSLACLANSNYTLAYEPGLITHEI